MGQAFFRTATFTNQDARFARFLWEGHRNQEGSARLSDRRFFTASTTGLRSANDDFAMWMDIAACLHNQFPSRRPNGYIDEDTLFVFNPPRYGQILIDGRFPTFNGFGNMLDSFHIIDASPDSTWKLSRFKDNTKDFTDNDAFITSRIHVR